MSDVEEIVRAGLAAVSALGARLGLPVTELKVLSARGNLIVHLAPAPVVARAATLTRWTRREPLAWMAREIAVAGYAARAGAPVVAPTELVDPGPHLVDGIPISLWDAHETRPGPADGHPLGAALGAFHIATADYVDPLPFLATAHEQIDDALHACERQRMVPADTLLALRTRHERVLADLDGAGSAPVVLHGDAHRGNLMGTAGGWMWTDLEETCAGPPEWDVAVMTGSGPDAAAVAAWSACTGRPVPTEEQLAPFRAARELEGLAWTLVMAHLYPQRYRAKADDQLALMLG